MNAQPVHYKLPLCNNFLICRDPEESRDIVQKAGDLELENEPKVKMRNISRREGKPRADEDGLQSFDIKESKPILSAKEFYGILTSIFICFVVFLPITLSWGALAFYAPQRPLVWATANFNETVAIKVLFISTMAKGVLPSFNNLFKLK